MSDRIPHPPHEEGSRRHVKYYVGVYRDHALHGEIRCSEPRCELNAPRLTVKEGEPEA